MAFCRKRLEEAIDYVYLRNSEKENVEKLECTISGKMGRQGRKCVAVRPLSSVCEP